MKTGEELQAVVELLGVSELTDEEFHAYLQWLERRQSDGRAREKRS